jgi:hypothetical protein
MLLVQVFNSAVFDADDGMTMVGSSGTILSVNQFALFSTDASFKGIDFGTSIITNIELNNLFFTAPAGGFAISGLAASGNIPVGSLAMVSNSEFSGTITDLENITTDDTRWLFKNNTPTPDTFADSLISFRNNATETVIGVGSGDNGNPILLTATWVEQLASQYTTTAAGRSTYNPERDAKVPVDLSIGLISSGGGAINVTVYLAFDGTVDSESGVQISISGSSAQTISIPWQKLMIEGRFTEVFVENNTNTTNIIGEYGTLRHN